MLFLNVSLLLSTLTVTCLFGHYVWRRLFSLQGMPPSLPWADCDRNAPLARAAATKRSFFGLRTTIERGYHKYSKRERTFVLPNLVAGPEVILPMSQVKWLLEQPDNLLSQNEVNRQFLHADRTMLDKKVILGTVHGNVIRREMTKDLDNYAQAIVEEIDDALGDVWGASSPGSREILTYQSMLNVIGRISNRVLVGLPLCRNKEYLHRTCTFARGVVITAGLINLLPRYLRPLLGPIITAYDTYQYRQITRFIFPIIKRREKSFRPGMDYRKPDFSKHNDYIQWALHDAYSHDDPTERSAEMITKRLTVLSFAAIQSSVITITNVLFDIASSPQCRQIQAELRSEVLAVLAEKPEELKWKRACLASMVKIDSTIRESMRLWGFISRGIMKKVIAPGGITIPSGEHLPYGAKVGVTSYAVHHDEDVYKNAFSFNPFRFCEVSEGNDRKIRSGAVSMVTSSDNFMAFSHGRHACPGRFFAANQLKLLLASIVLKYEIQPTGERPGNPWLNNSIGPPIWAKLCVRRIAPEGAPFSPLTTMESFARDANTNSEIDYDYDFEGVFEDKQDVLTPLTEMSEGEELKG